MQYDKQHMSETYWLIFVVILIKMRDPFWRLLKENFINVEFHDAGDTAEILGK